MLEAMIEERPVDLSYRSHRTALRGQGARRLRVHPLGVVFYRDGVYFIVDVAAERDGISAEYVGRRILLSVDRMDRLTLGDAGGFSVPSTFDARAFFGDAFGLWRDGEVLDVAVEIDAAYAPWVLERRFHPSQKVEQRTDGSVLLRMRASGSSELSDWVLSLGEHAEVVEPAELRERVRARLEKAAARYGKGGDIFRRHAPVESPSTPSEGGRNE